MKRRSLISVVIIIAINLIVHQFCWAFDNEKQALIGSFEEFNRVVTVNKGREKHPQKIIKVGTDLFESRGIKKSGNQQIGELSLNTHNVIKTDISVGDDSELIIGGISLETDDTSSRSTSKQPPGSIDNEGKLKLPEIGFEIGIGRGFDVCPVNPEDMSQLENDIDYAIMSACAYSMDKEGCDERQLKQSDWKVVQAPEESSSTVEYIVFKNEKTGKYAVAFRGTSGWEDWNANGLSGNRETSYDAVYEAAKQICKDYGPDVTFGGHSKGGGEALVAATICGEAVTFNHRPEVDTEDDYNNGDNRGYYVVGDELGIARVIYDAIPGGVDGGNNDIQPLPDINENGEIDSMFDSDVEHDMKGVIESMKYCSRSSGNRRTAGGGFGGGRGGTW